MKRFYYLYYLALIGILLIVALAGCVESEPKAAAAPVAPEVGVVTLAPELPGRTTPSQIADVRPPVGGVFAKLRCRARHRASVAMARPGTEISG